MPGKAGYRRIGATSCLPEWQGLWTLRLRRAFHYPLTAQRGMLHWLTPLVFLGAAQRKLCERGLLIFSWHRIGYPPAGTRDPFLYDMPERFDAQLAELAQCGCQAVTLSPVTRQGTDLRRKVALTFDDGFLSVLNHGLPVLVRRKLTAMQFLVADLLGKTNEWDVRKGDTPERLMDVSQVREWLAAGMEIGSHSMTHRNLRRLPIAEAREEIAASKKKLEDLFAVEVRHFSYPYGSWNEQLRDLTGEAGFQTASTMDFGVNDSATPVLALKRVFPLSSAELLRKVRHRLLRKCATLARFPGSLSKGR